MKKKSFAKTFKTTEEMDRYLEEEDLSELIKEHGVVVKPKIQKINLDLPEYLIRKIDSVAKRIGVSRQPLLKIWIHERLKSESQK
ncbi:MAG: CopG family antitoxin [Deltaproteobacteria bacterium]|nr:CopG family antitoxin [Deltaproteobacteria bacterium]